MDETLIKIIGCCDIDRMKKQCQKYDLTKVTEIDNKSEEQLETYEMTTEEEIKWLRKCVRDLQQERDEYKQIIKENTILVEDENGNYQETNIDTLKIIKQNQKLKKQLEELSKEIDKWNKIYNDEFDKNKNQQKEFIDYLENEIEKNCNSKNMSKCNLFQEILSKYKSIIGVSDESKRN